MATKSPASSRTVWFGVTFLIIGLALAIVSFLMEQPMFDAAALSVVSGVLTILLRFKTQVAIAFGVDDPTTPEDESTMAKKPDKQSGFALTRMLVILAVLSFAAMSLTGCAHLDPKEQEAVDASITCSIELLTAARTCLPECLAIEDPTAQKVCAIECTMETAEDVVPTCAQLYGNIHSDELGVAVRAAVESAFMIHDAVKK
jgi:hypothetical protein